MSSPDLGGLRVDDLTVSFDRGRRPVVKDLSLAVARGEALGLVGESGSGKSLTCRAILGLLPPGASVTGRIAFDGDSLLELQPSELQALRGSRIAMVFQDPMTALNPLLRVGDAIAQVVRAHDRVDRSTARRRAVESMERVGIRNAAQRASAYPHQFSGGMRQRVLIAMALAAHPTLLLADEPTTALDVIVQAGILQLLDRLRREAGMGLLIVSHDFAVVASVCDRLAVMYAGQLVEEGPASDVLFNSRHPYTRALIDSVPKPGDRNRLRSIPGSPPEPEMLPPGCAFAPRCPHVTGECRAQEIPLIKVSIQQASRCIHHDRLAPPRRVGDSGHGSASPTREARFA